MIDKKQNDIINKLNNCNEIKRFKELESIINNNNKKYLDLKNKLNSNLDNNEIIEIRKQLFSIDEVREYSMLENEIRLFSKKVSNIISSLVDTKKC